MKIHWCVMFFFTFSICEIIFIFRENTKYNYKINWKLYKNSRRCLRKDILGNRNFVNDKVTYQLLTDVKISGTNNGRHWPRHTFGMVDHGDRGGKRHASNSAGTTLYVVAYVGQRRSLLWKVCLLLPFFLVFFSSLL